MKNFVSMMICPVRMELGSRIATASLSFAYRFSEKRVDHFLTASRTIAASDLGVMNPLLSTAYGVLPKNKLTFSAEKQPFEQNVNPY